MYVHEHTPILFNQFSIYSMDMCLGLTTGNWITYQGECPKRHLVLIFFLSSTYLIIALHLAMGPCKISPICANISTNVIIM